MKPIWGPLIKLAVYTLVVLMGTGLLLLVIVNGRTGATETYRAVFSDASGVGTNDSVKIAGVVVGKVTGVKVVDKSHAEIEFTVDKDIELPASLGIAIQYENLIGDRYLNLERPRDAGGPLLEPGSTVPESRTEPALNLTVLFGGFRPLFQALEPAQVNKFAEEVLHTLQGEGGTVEQLLVHTASLTNTVADRDQVIGQLIDDLNVVLGSVSSRDRQLSNLLLQLQRFVSGLSEDRSALGTAISSISMLTDSVTGLLVEGRAPLRDDILALGDLAGHLDRGKGAIDEELKAIGPLLNRVDRTASYGSWFQFYLCSMGGSFASDGGRAGVTPYVNNAERCSS
ncbi:MCE family protein [Nocardioides humilatus]|uniref:MCE family protein n=1 Tax=Nocardioides humilatus TaxID=2607660 RepID=A0A5B1LJR2_9ACTN|nr:MCE family protein [Nocardioides humilatus]KAA1420975.1 MCE family protein [Nocardioides humilatus]